MTQTYIYAGAALAIGFAIAWAIHIVLLLKSRKSQKSIEGFLESEKLIRERFQKENAQLHRLKETTQQEYEEKIQSLQKLVRRMDEDILLLQKSNEETEALLQAGEPVVHSLKLKLIEANNTIARYKAQVFAK